MATLSVQSTIPSKIELEESLNVVIIVTYAHPYIGSGLGVIAKFQAEALASRGHNVTLISSNIPQTSKTFVLNGVTYLKVPAAALLERLHVPVPILFFNKSVIRAIRNADIVHVHDILYPSSFLAALLGKLHNKRVILTQHVPHVQYSNKIINTIEKLAFHSVGKVTLWASDATIVYNPYVHKWINIPLNKFVVLFVGRFVPKKGFDILYNAKDPSYLLVFVGGGIIPEHIKSDDSVSIMGPLPQEELAMIYKASDAFILPSYGEGFPLSIQEAMASGLPIITSKHNNLDPIVDIPLITYIDITETDIRSAIKKIQYNRTLRQEMGEYSSKVARENFSWEKNTIDLLDIYRKMSN